MAGAAVNPRNRPKNREETRRRLLDSAAVLFTRNGFNDTSIEEIVAHAGYTRGAFYSNFKTKDELFLEIMAERMDRVASDLAAVADETDLDGVLEAMSEQEARRPTQQREDVFVLSIEFWLYAMRNPDVRRKLARKYSAARRTLGAVIAEVCEGLGVDPPLDAEVLGGVILALDTGVLLQRYADPKGLPADVQAQVARRLLQAP